MSNSDIININLLSLQAHYIDVVLEQVLKSSIITNELEVYNNVRSAMDSGIISVHEMIVKHGNDCLVVVEDIHDQVRVNDVISLIPADSTDFQVVLSNSRTYKYGEIDWFLPVSTKLQLPKLFVNAK